MVISLLLFGVCVYVCLKVRLWPLCIKLLFILIVIIVLSCLWVSRAGVTLTGSHQSLSRLGVNTHIYRHRPPAPFPPSALSRYAALAQRLGVGEGVVHVGVGLGLVPGEEPGGGGGGWNWGGGVRTWGKGGVNHLKWKRKWQTCYLIRQGSKDLYQMFTEAIGHIAFNTSTN